MAHRINTFIKLATLMAVPIAVTREKSYVIPSIAALSLIGVVVSCVLYVRWRRPTRCAVCGIHLSKRKYRWRLNGNRIWACRDCNHRRLLHEDYEVFSTYITKHS